MFTPLHDILSANSSPSLSQSLPEFKAKGFAVVGVRNAKGAKGADVSQKVRRNMTRARRARC